MAPISTHFTKAVIVKQGPARPMMRPLATFSFLIFFNDFSFFLSPRPSFLLAPPSSSSLLPPHPSFPRPALSKSFRIRKSPFFINFDESITDGRTDQVTNQPTDKASYRDADASNKHGSGCVVNTTSINLCPTQGGRKRVRVFMITSWRRRVLVLS